MSTGGRTDEPKTIVSFDLRQGTKKRLRTDRVTTTKDSSFVPRLRFFAPLSHKF